MSKFLFTLAAITIIAATTSVAMAQGGGADDYEYVPMVQEGNKWVYFQHLLYMTSDSTDTIDDIFYSLEMSGDTTINDKSFKKLYRYKGEKRPTNLLPRLFIREFNNTLSIVLNEDSTIDNAEAKQHINNRILMYGYVDGSIPKWKLYDLPGGESPGITAYLYPPFNDNHAKASWLEVGSSVRKCYTVVDIDTTKFIDGIGPDCWNEGDLLSFTPYIPAAGYEHHVGLCFMQDMDGNIVYKGQRYQTYVDLAGVDGVKKDAAKAVRSVEYVNLQGMQSRKPFAGFNIVVTTYTDGSRTSTKKLLP